MFRARVLLAGLAAIPIGCFSARSSAPESFLSQFARNATQQPVKHHDDRHFIHVVRTRAEDAYREATGPGRRRHSDPYHDGFVDGFLDYVEAGGTGEPPYLPPFRYRLTRYRTSADGEAVTEAWYAGFRDGSGAARVSGLRELNYVPLPGPAVPADARVVEPMVVVTPAPSSGRSPWETPGSVAAPRPEPTPQPLPPPVPVPVPVPIPPAIPAAPPAAVPVPDGVVTPVEFRAPR